ncbi:TetR/AcrR family transcriptional regulator [Microbacterium halophytorum]|uniref:TetR/AcrR family transcriptional regulator n=1 Tax=Microbacterium halophytorum TaxID=2067568 RepID=UPI000CFC1EE3|nr:TetR/AcrR family transcriptional regulator [Microbacterium halophytorum]
MSRSSAGYHHGNLRAALLDAADAMLAESGSASLSLREVARRADVSHNAPYHHFADRRALLKALAERHMSRLLDAQRAAAAASEPATRLREVGRAYVGYAIAHPQAFGVVFDPEVCVPGHPTETMAPLIRANEELLADVIREAAPELEPDARASAEAGLWAFVHGLAELIIAGHLPPEVAESAADGLAAVIAR